MNGSLAIRVQILVKNSACIRPRTDHTYQTMYSLLSLVQFSCRPIFNTIPEDSAHVNILIGDTKKLHTLPETNDLLTWHNGITISNMDSAYMPFKSQL